YGGDAGNYANIRIEYVADGQVLVESSQVLSVSSSATDHGLYVYGSNLVISDTLIAGNGDSVADYGLRATNNSAVTISYSTFQDNAGYGLYVNGSQASLTCSTVANNGSDGIYLASSDFWTLGSSIQDNAGYGLNNGSAITATATYNWWGATDGPGGVGPGSGDEVSNYVLYDPWLLQPGCVCDLLVGKSDDPDPALASAPLTYTLSLFNNGPGEATAVVLTDTLPAGMTYLGYSATQGVCAGNGGLVTCTLDLLAVGTGATISITVDTDPDLRGLYTNTAVIAASETDYVPESNLTVEGTTLYGEADLSVAKNDEPDPVMAGAPLTYTVVVGNGGPSTAFGVALTDTLPAGIAFGGAVPSQGSCAELAGTVRCNLGAIDPAAAATVLITGTVEPMVRGVLTNTVMATTSDSDPNPGNNSELETTTVIAEADLSVAKSDDPDPVFSGAVLTYTVVVSNSGPSIALDATLTDTLPTEVTFGAAIPSQGSCTEMAGTVRCDLGALAPAAAATVLIAVTVDPTADGIITNQALVAAAEPDPNPADNVDVETTEVVLVEPAMDIEAEPSSLLANGVDTAILTVTAVMPGGSFAGQVVTITWNLGFYPSPVTVTLDANSVATYTYTAGVIAGTDIVTAELHALGETLLATTSIELVNNPLAGWLDVTIGRPFTYTFVVSNASHLPQTNLVMTGSLPAYTELVTVTGGTFVPDGGDYGWGYVIAEIPTLAAGERYTLSWSLLPLRFTGDIVTQAHARSDTAVLRLELAKRIYRILLSLVTRDAPW
ncbi:MAG: DUF11 domain-containing protein, partial [Anaerolineae bacterium]|nr:DUF11 domain-containing protein [Anaerolineae bacterium]